MTRFATIQGRSGTKGRSELLKVARGRFALVGVVCVNHKTSPSFVPSSLIVPEVLGGDHVGRSEG